MDVFCCNFSKPTQKHEKNFALLRIIHLEFMLISFFGGMMFLQAGESHHPLQAISFFLVSPLEMPNLPILHTSKGRQRDERWRPL